MITFSFGTSLNKLNVLPLLIKYKVLNNRLKMTLMPTCKEIWRILINIKFKINKIIRIKTPYNQKYKKILKNIKKRFQKMHQNQKKPFIKMTKLVKMAKMVKMAIMKILAQTLACNNKIIVKLHSLNHKNTHNHNNNQQTHKLISPSHQSTCSQYGPCLV